MKVSPIQIVPISSLFLVSIILLDSFKLQTFPTSCILQKKDLNIGYSRSKPIVHYKLIDTKGFQYEVSYRTNLTVAVGDTFFVARTHLFGKAIYLSYQNDKEPIGVLTNGGVAIPLVILSVLLSALTIILPVFSKNRRIIIDLAIMTAIVTISVLCYYFVAQS